MGHGAMYPERILIGEHERWSFSPRAQRRMEDRLDRRHADFHKGERLRSRKDAACHPVHDKSETQTGFRVCKGVAAAGAGVTEGAVMGAKEPTFLFAVCIDRVLEETSAESGFSEKNAIGAGDLGLAHGAERTLG